MKKIFKKATETTEHTTKMMLDKTDVISDELKRVIEERVAPVRTSVLQRYPVLFSFLITFGLATTYYGFERILAQYEVLNNNPWLIMLIGVGVLTFTGTLYKKMD